MPYVKVRSIDGIVTDVSAAPAPGYFQVDSVPSTQPRDVLRYADGAVTVDDADRVARKGALEPELLMAHARWQSAVTLGLDCEAHCRAKYESLRAEYDAL